MPFVGPIEVDWAAKRNKHKGKKLKAGRHSWRLPCGARKDQRSARSSRIPTPRPQKFAYRHRWRDSLHRMPPLTRAPFDHTSVHSVGEYVRDMAHTNGIERSGAC